MIFGLERIVNIDHREQCRAYALELLDSLNSIDLMAEFTSVQKSCHQQLGDCALSVNAKSLQGFYLDIKKARQIDEEPYHALLSSPVLSAGHEQVLLLQRLTALVLIASISGEMIDTRVNSALRQLRLLAMGLNSCNSSEEVTVSTIPKGVGENGRWLEDLHELMSADNKTMRNRFTPIHRLLKDFIEGTPTNIKHRNPSNSIKEGNRYEGGSKRLVDNTSDVSSLNIYEFKQVTHTDYVNRQEHVADQVAFSRVVDMELIAPEAVRTSLVLQNQRARQIANQLIKNEKRLITAWNQLTPNELRISVKLLLHSLNHGDHSAGLLLLVLLLGISPQEVISSIRNNEKNQARRIGKVAGKYVLDRRIVLPVHEHSDHAAKLVRSSDISVQLPIPEVLISTVLHVYESDNDGKQLLEQLNQHLSLINVQEGTRLTLGRFKLYFTDWLLAESVDTPLIEWFKGVEVTEHSGVYYSQIEKTVLIELYSEFIKHVLPREALKPGLSQANLNTLPFLGSQLFVKTNAVLKLGEHYRERLKCGVASDKDYQRYHNEYTAYTYLILNLATGHRPVRDPFATIKAFSVSTKTVYIQDKDVAGQQSGRVLALPDIAIEQYSEYLKYIEMIHRQYQFTSHNLSEYSKQVLLGEQALLFWLKDEIPLRLKPSNIFNEMKHVFPYPVNWHRHHMRTVLSRRNNETQLIDAFMGHSVFGNETFSAFSGESLGQMNHIADDIQDYLVNTLGLSAIEARV